MTETGKEMTNVPRHDILLTNVTDADLRQMAREYDMWHLSGTIHDDAVLREKGRAFGIGPIGMISAALHVFRQMANRNKLY